MKLIDMQLKDYILKARDKTSVPGGGSIAALAGALSASLSMMVLNLSGAEDKTQEYDEFSKILEANIDEDSTSFDDVLKAFRLPKETEEEKKVRAIAIEEGYKRAIDVPLSTMEAVYGIVKKLKGHQSCIGKEALSDLYMVADLALCAFHGAKHTAEINIDAIKDEAAKAVYREKIRVLAKKMYGDCETLSECSGP
ncbi:MAG: cyclodeaminase/cyclohydrolase family protein [Peptoniphilus sp.]|nr:cyclodeaminase/cyclohydrolase family protein [Peptoniphilus sp.]MDY3118316.1 cyclodeaminase/cyclohydrolase family protein [Peptoniphilus sp.]